MANKWTRNQSDAGILRKNEFKEKKEELFVFGYSCKLFRDDEKALHIDQGKHLIPWMGDEALKIDRYDARGALHSLAPCEAPPGGFDWRVELTKTEQDVEQLCDEERYRALHTDEDEEEMYREEELKRLHAAGYGQVGFNYDTGSMEKEKAAAPTEIDEPFVPPPRLVELLPPDTILPETVKLNAIVEKTANFISSQGAQMEILLRAKQADNEQFQFLNKDSPLHPYYLALIGLARGGKWPEREEEIMEEPKQLNEDYLHPSLASAVIESAPSIPSIHYRPSADCDYTMLISKIRGDVTLDETYEPQLAPGELPPPGTEITPRPDISRPPVMYHTPQVPPPGYPPPAPYAPCPAMPPLPPSPPRPAASTGLSLMKHYDTDSDSDNSDEESTSSTSDAPPPPPSEVRLIIDKMASYVARNGDEFADIVRAKNDPRFTFLHPTHLYHGYYLRTMHDKRSGEKVQKKTIAPVSFSIKKLKEPEPALPKPALPYESSSDEEGEKDGNKQNATTEKPQEQNVIKTTTNKVAPIITAPIYKVESQPKLINYDKPAIIMKPPEKSVIENKTLSIGPEKIDKEEKKEKIDKDEKNTKVSKEKEPPEVDKKKLIEESKECKRKEDKVERENKKDRKVLKKNRERSRSERRERRKSVEREKRKHRDEDDKRKKVKEKDPVQSEIISLEDNSDDNNMIDLTGDQSDSKEVEVEVSGEKQVERRRRAAHFLKTVGVDPAHAALPTTSLASAMVDTLESIRKRKQEAEERRRRKEKRRKRERDRYDDDRSHKKSKKHKNDDDESDYDGSKKKKRKKDKRHTKHKKRRKQSSCEEVPPDQPLDIDLSNTLKVLRTTSPTNHLVVPDQEDKDTLERPSRTSANSSSSDCSEEGEPRKRPQKKNKKKKEDREYSEGEWSSGSDADNVSEKNGL